MNIQIGIKTNTRDIKFIIKKRSSASSRAIKHKTPKFGRVDTNYK